MGIEMKLSSPAIAAAALAAFFTTACAAHDTIEPAAPVGADPERADIARIVSELSSALAARDIDRVLAAYDARDERLMQRTRALYGRAFELGDAKLSLRLARIASDGGDVEAAVFASCLYHEHGRDQVRSEWRTLRFRRAPEQRRIVYDESRNYARSIDTRLDVSLDPEAGRMQGTSSIEIEITAAGETSLLLDLNRGLEISSLIDEHGGLVRFERTADLVVIPVDQALESGERMHLAIHFEGALFNESKEQGYSQVSLSPAGSFASWVTSWYPRVHGDGSKSKGRITYDVPAGTTVASSGRCTETAAHGERAKQVFAVEQPLDFSFAAASYFHREDVVDGVVLGIYLLSGGDAKADLYLRECKRVLRCERDLYGSYPFDSYAVVEIPSSETGSLGGSSEQGMNLFPVGALPNDRFPLMLVAHEIGHSWWGNLVSSGASQMVGEGLAQMTAVLCLRELEGDQSMRRFLENGHPGYPQSAKAYFLRFAGVPALDLPLDLVALGADDISTLHDLADSKGVCVYAMLRDEIGHEAFVAGLRSVIASFAGRTATLDDLRAAWEKASRRDLSTYFAQWLHKSGAPELTLQSTTVAADGAYTTSGTLRQSGDPYDVHAEIALAGAGDRRIESIAVSGTSTPFTIRTSFEPRLVVLDPQHKILRWTGAIRHRQLLADARGLWSAGKTEDALAKLGEYMELATDGWSGRVVRGVFHQEAGELADAERTFRSVIDDCRALDIEPALLPTCTLHLAQVLDIAGRRDEALKTYQTALAMPDESNSHAAARAGLKAPYRFVKKSPPPDASVLTRFAGDYGNGRGLTVHVVLSSAGVLTAAQSGQPAYPLEWVEGARFRIAASSDYTLVFVGEPRAERLDLTIGDLHFELPRLP
jgi:hypothetical protein